MTIPEEEEEQLLAVDILQEEEEEEAAAVDAARRPDLVDEVFITTLVADRAVDTLLGVEVHPHSTVIHQASMPWAQMKKKTTTSRPRRNYSNMKMKRLNRIFTTVNRYYPLYCPNIGS